ncbi:hypothetical protein L484_013153 [Morus notabilis]|uniref:Protein NEOXANTHIN-DEFICIENT 1 n=1 Tax=Morus notabilis TaxID=981085 RepID=W9RM68_9ROSA|nr:protein NEOXANTHIN-DEFICIENT 1 isoform X1 [Morus notabilis]EXB81212.1 hypothetical protein L484_013153 [Morus notabilis]
MDNGETKDASGYGKPPWIFKGSALYQLHLVKAKTARACIPKDLRLVEAFGYTLGGFFLASYDDSPAGVFDELVVIAGLVWNPPTSCAWATKVLVNSDEACEHGRKEVGLPSQVARFSKRITSISRQQDSSRSTGFLNMFGMGTGLSDWYSRDRMDVQVTAEDTSSFNLTSLVPAFSLDKWMGPSIKMSLPSFSGRTQHTPDLLKYSCKIQCRVRAVHPAKVSGPTALLNGEMEQSSDTHNGCTTLDQSARESISTAVMLSKPIFALKFSCMTMQVEAPVVVSDCPKTSLRTC